MTWFRMERAVVTRRIGRVVEVRGVQRKGGSFTYKGKAVPGAQRLQRTTRAEIVTNITAGRRSLSISPLYHQYITSSADTAVDIYTGP